MCQCCRDSSSLDVTDQSKMKTYSKSIISLLKNEVYVVIFQKQKNEDQKTVWKQIYSDASSQLVKQSYDSNENNIASSIISTEAAILQLSIGSKGNSPVSYRLKCHNSRIYTRVLDPSARNLRLVVINKYGDAGQAQQNTLDEEVNIDKRLEEISKQFYDALSPTSSHND